MEDKIFDAVDTLMEDYMQQFSYQVGDMLNEVPPPLAPIALAIMQAIVASHTERMPESARDLYDICLNKIKVVALPPELDPRKNKEGE